MPTGSAVNQLPSDASGRAVREYLEVHRRCGVRKRHAEPLRRVTRSIQEGARDLSKTDAWLISRRERTKVEMLFAHLKRILKLDRLRLRGPCGARDWPLVIVRLRRIADTEAVGGYLPRWTFVLSKAPRSAFANCGADPTPQKCMK